MHLGKQTGWVIMRTLWKNVVVHTYKSKHLFKVYSQDTFYSHSYARFVLHYNKSNCFLWSHKLLSFTLRKYLSNSQVWIAKRLHFWENKESKLKSSSFGMPLNSKDVFPGSVFVLWNTAEELACYQFCDIIPGVGSRIFTASPSSFLHSSSQPWVD